MFPCQHHSIITQYFCVPLSASFHQCTVLLCFLSVPFYPYPVFLYSCQHHSVSSHYFCVNRSVLFHHCSVLLCSPVSTILSFLSTSVFFCQNLSTSAQYSCVFWQYLCTLTQYLCVPLSASFHHFSVLLCSSISIFPPVLSTPVFSISIILLLPNTSVPFHQFSVLLCSPVGTFPPPLRNCFSTIHALGSTVLIATLSNNCILCRATD